MVKVLESIPDEFIKGYMAGEIAKAKSFMVDIALVDICGGNLPQAIILSRILFWHRPNEKGQSRLRVKAEGHLWLARNNKEWFEECRIPDSTARRAIKKLEEAGLIVTMTTGFNGLRTPHIRMNWEVFSKKLKAWASDSEPEIEVDEDEHLLKMSESKRSKWTFGGNLSAQIGQLDVLTTTDHLLKSSRPSAQNEQTICSNRADHLLKMSESNTCSTHVDTCNTQEKEITSTKLLPVGDKSDNQDEPIEGETEMAESEITPDAQASESELAPEDQTPESKPEPEKTISEDEWIGTREAMIKAIAYAFETKESYSGFGITLCTQLEGTAKKGKRKEFRLEDPATPAEVWGFGAWYEDRELNAPTSSELLYERFEEFRSLKLYSKYQSIGEHTLRYLYREANQPAEPEEGIRTEETRAASAQFLDRFLAKAEESNRKLTDPRNDEERKEAIKRMNENVRALAKKAKNK